MRKTVATLLLLPAALMPAAAMAATSLGTIDVSATIQSTCTVGNTALAFGPTGGGQVDITPTISVTCTNGTPYTIALDAGQGTGATADQRLMTGTNQAGTKYTLAYSIFRDTARSQPWGNATNNTVSGQGNGTQIQVPLYARLFANTSAVSGLTYTDTVNVTLSY